MGTAAFCCYLGFLINTPENIRVQNRFEKDGREQFVERTASRKSALRSERNGRWTDVKRVSRKSSKISRTASRKNESRLEWLMN